jgi:putative endonuclease
MYFVYILSNKHLTVFYTGVTNDLARRMIEHKTGFYRKAFSKMYNCSSLLYFEEFETWKEAADREVELKRFRREWKLQLVQKMNPELRDLSETGYDSERAPSGGSRRTK